MYVKIVSRENEMKWNLLLAARELFIVYSSMYDLISRSVTEDSSNTWIIHLGVH